MDKHGPCPARDVEGRSTTARWTRRPPPAADRLHSEPSEHLATEVDALSAMLSTGPLSGGTPALLPTADAEPDAGPAPPTAL